jgi:hypothetical protein
MKGTGDAMLLGERFGGFRRFFFQRVECRAAGLAALFRSIADTLQRAGGAIAHREGLRDVNALLHQHAPERHAGSE